MADTAVVADTSPLIGLARIGRLSLLEAVFRTVYLPRTVFDEATADPRRPGSPGMNGIEDRLQPRMRPAQAVDDLPRPV